MGTLGIYAQFKVCVLINVSFKSQTHSENHTHRRRPTKKIGRMEVVKNMTQLPTSASAAQSLGVMTKRDTQ